jgi:hypothetical protein
MSRVSSKGLSQVSISLILSIRAQAFEPVLPSQSPDGSLRISVNI